MDRTIEETTKLFRQSRERSKNRSSKIVVDGLWAYEKGFNKVFYSRYKDRRVEFIRRTGIKVRETNNVVERLHGILKDRLKPMRGFKNTETAQTILDSWFVYYDFLRAHQTLNGKTLAEASWIDLNLEMIGTISFI